MSTPSICLLHVEAIALAVDDFERARNFYTDTLSLPPAMEDGKQIGNRVGDTILMFKTGGYARPTDAPNPRITLKAGDAPALERELRAKGVAIPDPVQRYGEALVGSFLDSEGNKLWFCSDGHNA